MRSIPLKGAENEETGQPAARIQTSRREEGWPTRHTRLSLPLVGRVAEWRRQPSEAGWGRLTRTQQTSLLHDDRTPHPVRARIPSARTTLPTRGRDSVLAARSRNDGREFFDRSARSGGGVGLVDERVGVGLRQVDVGL